jgi:hypothetical protein
MAGGSPHAGDETSLRSYPMRPVRTYTPDEERQDEAKRWKFVWDDAGQCWRCWRCLVTVQQFKNLKRHFNGVKCKQRSSTLACQSSRRMLQLGGFKVHSLPWLVSRKARFFATF